MARPKKPVNTFEVYQEERQAKRIAHINAYLKVAKDSRAHFKYVTDLAEMVAAHLSQMEGTKCSRSTLLRNLKYKGLLLSYMAGDVASGVKNAIAKNAESPAAQALAVHSQLELANLKRENVRLKAYIAELKDQVSQTEIPKLTLADAKVAVDDSAFVRTCQVLLRVLENSDGLLTVDLELERLLDASRIIDNVIADQKLAAPFIAWLRANRTR
jgi:hypothetical protein